jgi:methionyl-tRNA formyltransferase
MKNIVVFANGNLGIRVIEYFFSSLKNNLILAVVLNDDSKRDANMLKNLKMLCHKYSQNPEIFIYEKEIFNSLEFTRVMEGANYAFSALFGHRIPPSIINHFKDSIINLHPSLLPLGRGSDPIPWSIIEDKPQGVSIHQIDTGLDTGAVLAQRELRVEFGDNAGRIYESAMIELFNLFTEFVENEFVPTMKIEQHYPETFHLSADLNEVRTSLLEIGNSMEYHLRIIQALTYSDGRGARVRLRNGETWEIAVSTSRILP